MSAQLSLFDAPPVVGVQYAVVDTLSGEAVEVLPQRALAEAWASEANARFGPLPARARDVDPAWRRLPDDWAGRPRYIVSEWRD